MCTVRLLTVSRSICRGDVCLWSQGGMSAQGMVSAWGVSTQGGVCLQGVFARGLADTPQGPEADTPLPVDRQTPVKTVKRAVNCVW